MTAGEAKSVPLDSQSLKSVAPAQIGAAASKLFAASVGDIVIVLSRSTAHKHYSLADIEWMVLSPVTLGQFYVVETSHKDHGFTAPVAFVTWAFVSEEVDRRLEQQTTRPVRLRPDEWKNGHVGWLIDAVGSPAMLRPALQWLKSGLFKERPLKLLRSDESGKTRVETLDDLMSA